VISGAIQDNVGTAVRNLAVTVNSGTLVLGGALPNTYSGATTLNGGTLELAGAGDAIPHGPGKGSVVFGNTLLPASLLLNGISERINGLIGTSSGAKVIDNNALSAATLVLGDGGAAVLYNGNITNSGGGPLSIVKTGTGAASLSGGTLSYTGTTEVQAGSTLSFPVATPSATRGIIVAGGAGLSFSNGVGTPISGLSPLVLGDGFGPTILGLDVGTNSDTLTATGPVTTAGTILFAINAVSGFASTGGIYDLLVSSSGGFGAAGFGVSAVPGGFTYGFDLSNPNKVRLVATPTAGNEVYSWTGDQDTSWSSINGGNTNWEKSVGEAGATPGATDVVVFSSFVTPPVAQAGNIVFTTLDGNRTVASIEFNGVANPGTAAANVRIAQGTGGVLTISPDSSSDGLFLSPSSGTASIGAPVELARDQTWNVSSIGTVTAALTVSGPMSGTGSLRKDGTGTVALAGNNTRVGATIINAGVLSINAEAALGANPASPSSSHLTIDGGTLRSAAVLTIDDVNRGIWLDPSGGTIDTTGGIVTIQNSIGGPGALTKGGASLLILNAANTFAGATTVNAGGIRIGNSSALGLGPIVLNSTATSLELADGIGTAYAVTLSDFGNDKTIRLQLGATAATFGGSVSIAESTAGNVRAQASGSGTLNLTATFSSLGTSAAGLRVNELAGNTGLVVLSGANTYAGLTEVRGGTLQNGVNDVIPGGMIVNGAQSANPSATYDLGGRDESLSALTFGATASSAAAFVNTVTTGAGTLTLGGNVTTIAGNVGTRAVLAGNVALSGIRTFTVAEATGQPTDLLISANLSGPGGLTKAGIGTIEMTGASTYIGTTTISAGTVLVNGSLTGAVSAAGGTLGGSGSVGLVQAASGGRLAPGGKTPESFLGTLRAQNVTMLSGSTFELEISPSTLASDRLVSLQDLALAIAPSPGLSISVVGSDVPLAFGTKFTFLSYSGNWNGGLFAIAGNPISDDIEYFQIGVNMFSIDYNDGGKNVSLIAVPEPCGVSLALGGCGLLAGLPRRRKSFPGETSGPMGPTGSRGGSSRGAN